jgi:hypothetical protein
MELACRSTKPRFANWLSRGASAKIGGQPQKKQTETQGRREAGNKADNNQQAESVDAETRNRHEQDDSSE